MFGHLLGCYAIYTFSGALAPDGILPGAKFTLCPSLAFACIGSVTARHSSSGCQPNFTELNRGRHLYLAGRPLRWASAHILVMFVIHNQCNKTNNVLNDKFNNNQPFWNFCDHSICWWHQFFLRTVLQGSHYAGTQWFWKVCMCAGATFL